MSKVLLSALVALCLGSVSCGSTGNPKPGLESSPEASVPAGPAVDHTVLVVTGTGYQTTQPFKIPSSEFTLTWTLTGDATYGSASFFVYNSKGDRVDEVLDSKPGTDSSTVHEGKDVFFIEILDANASYKLTVSAKYPGPDQVFTLPAMSPVTKVSGSGSKSSPTFHITGDIWRITVQSGKPSKYTSVTAYVQKSGADSSLSQASVEGAQGGSKVISYVYEGPGDYYIKVLSANTTWTVTVEQTSS
ncbi:MAG TPA: hypothetical protein VGV87_24625 [Blastocatellia bacterium]|nr:hypothetical protein [Blastocatellia bacterium]